jgi:hypothetical protein
MEHLLLFRTFSRNILANKSISFDKSDVDTNETGSIDLSSEALVRISPIIANYYKVFISFEQIWTFKNDEEIRGFTNIIPLKESIEDDEPKYMHGLRMLDYFVPEACVGFYLAKKNQKPDDELYYLYFENEPVGLNVDMDGYVQLLYMSRGYAHWQKALLFFQGNKDVGVSWIENFKMSMSQVFPDFKWEDFVALYEKVKLR